MAKKLTKGKRKYLVSLIKEKARCDRVLQNAMRDARRLARDSFELRQNRAYMAIYC